jgi:hypothetical protein
VSPAGQVPFTPAVFPQTLEGAVMEPAPSARAPQRPQPGIIRTASPITASAGPRQPGHHCGSRRPHPPPKPLTLAPGGQRHAGVRGGAPTGARRRPRDLSSARRSRRLPASPCPPASYRGCPDRAIASRLAAARWAARSSKRYGTALATAMSGRRDPPAATAIAICRRANS